MFADLSNWAALLNIHSASALRNFLNRKVEQYNHPDFIEGDPISIPHRFSAKEDVEIAGLIAAMFAWGQRKTILQKTGEFIRMMDHQPHSFVLNHSEADLKSISRFKHRTFNGTDALYLIHFLKKVYTQDESLEKAFFPAPDPAENAVEQALLRFGQRFRNDPFYQSRTGKHMSSPSTGSACKRLNMFLRWMVRKDDTGVDFGIWHSVTPGQLVCPCDVHVERNARLLGLVQRPKPDWKMALELTERLRQLDPEDPVKYDFALFGMGASSEEFPDAIG